MVHLGATIATSLANLADEVAQDAFEQEILEEFIIGAD